MTWNSELELAEENVMAAALEVIDSELKKMDEREKAQAVIRAAHKEALAAYAALKEQNGRKN